MPYKRYSEEFVKNLVAEYNNAATKKERLATLKRAGIRRWNLERLAAVRGMTITQADAREPYKKRGRGRPRIYKNSVQVGLGGTVALEARPFIEVVRELVALRSKMQKLKALFKED